MQFFFFTINYLCPKVELLLGDLKCFHQWLLYFQFRILSFSANITPHFTVISSFINRPVLSHFPFCKSFWIQIPLYIQLFALVTLQLCLFNGFQIIPIYVYLCHHFFSLGMNVVCIQIKKIIFSFYFFSEHLWCNFMLVHSWYVLVIITTVVTMHYYLLCSLCLPDWPSIWSSIFF